MEFSVKVVAPANFAVPSRFDAKKITCPENRP
jgi:hypothetical protein